MKQILKEYFLTFAALVAYYGGVIFSLLFFRPTGSLASINDIEASLAISIFGVCYMALLHKRDKNINKRMKITL